MGLLRWLALKLLSAMGRLPHQYVRRYSVTHFGEFLGTFTLPVGEHMEDRNANERPILTKPVKVNLGGYYYLYWVERYPNGGYKTVTWHIPTPELREEAARFYNTAYGLRPDGTPDPAKQPPLATRTVEETRLIRAIIANHEAEQPYLDYAAWLIAKGNSYGDYIKLTLEIKKLPEDDPRRERPQDRREEIIEKNAVKWVRPLIDLGLFPGVDAEGVDGFLPVIWYNSKGVIEEMDVPGDTVVFPNNLPRLFYGAPCLRKLAVNDTRVTVADFASLPQMAQIEVLKLSIGHGTENDFLKFAMSPHLTGLRELDISSLHCGPAGAAHLANAQWLAGVHTLKLSSNYLGDQGVEVFAESPHIANLTALDLSYSEMTDGGLAALCRSPHLRKLTKLTLNNNNFTVEGMRALANAPFAATLTTLSLNTCSLNAEAVAALAAANFPALNSLDVSFNPIDDAGLSALVGASFFRNLEVFYANSVSCVDGPLEAMAALGFLPLRELELGYNEITAEGFSALVRSKAVSKLVKLDLSRNPIKPPGIIALAETDFPALEELYLTGVPCGPAGAKALADSPYFKKLKNLWLSEEHIGVNGREAVIARFTNSVASIY